MEEQLASRGLHGVEQRGHGQAGGPERVQARPLARRGSAAARIWNTPRGVLEICMAGCEQDNARKQIYEKFHAAPPLTV